MLHRAPRLILALLAVCATAAQAQDATHFPGKNDRGFLLPNGWTISPAGDQVTLTDLPLNIIALPGGKQALVATSGYNAHELSLVDLEAKKVITKATQRQSWFGLAFDAKSGKIWWAGGGSSVVHPFTLNGTEIVAKGEKTEPAPATKGAPQHFRSGLTLSNDGKTLFSLDIDAGAISATALEGGKVSTGKVGSRPYDVIQSKATGLLYVSDWVGRTVLAVHPTELRVLAKISVGEHPNQIVEHPKDGRLFVACASSNTVVVIDPKRGHAIETIFTSLFPLAPEGSTPDAVAVAPDGETLYVANADNNSIAVIDIETPGKSQVKGFIPTGWYPTSVAVTPDNTKLLIGVGKGNQTKPNPRPKSADADAKLPFPYIGTTLSGALSIVNIPDEKALAAYTETVYKNCPYSDRLLSNAPSTQKTAIPNKVGDPSPIKHVLYIIKENRTYDQVFSDIPRGNRDPALLMFGEEITPNHHKLANDFVLLDNLYCNGHVSADGHPWSTMAYNTDYIARNWALTYSRRAGVDADDDGDLAKAPSGYIWDACARLGLSYRSYGEYGRRVSEPDGSLRMEGAVPGLVGHMSPEFGTPATRGKRARDTDNADVFIREFKKYEAENNLPRFMVMSLGEDHTSGTSPGAFTPQACVASNDVALGKIVETITKSKYWPQTAIFVIEDDAQNGPDHVDAHRTIGLVISPYTKRGQLDSTQYSTVSMLRTMELILGIPPLSQFDAAATPMFNSFTDKADLTTYTALPARIDLNATNTATAYGADRSSKMDFSEYDKIDDFELNEILWRAIKGKDAPLPPAVRRAIAYRPLPNAK